MDVECRGLHEIYSMKSRGGIIRFTVGELNGSLKSCATNAPIQLLQKIDMYYQSCRVTFVGNRTLFFAISIECYSTS